MGPKKLTTIAGQGSVKAFLTTGRPKPSSGDAGNTSNNIVSTRETLEPDDRAPPARRHASASQFHQQPVAGQEAAQAHQARRPEPVVSPSKRRKLNEPSAGSAGAGPSGTLPAMRPATRLPQPSPRTSPSTSQQSVEIVASPLQFVTSTLCASRLKSLYPKCNKLTSQLGSESIQTIFENGKFENQLVRP
ncbi:hypothetical protein VOLCADRAFT_89034 [Volvox carteri f. nagariensis]|uniref:Uncharacterized protein n=1 Tax=Volvox carteri f. nagariensis TaxID=3068 RepID=D8TQM1_VOLCA|nr:uncharacterized protein VOLCADRAFT_89034 [Volvox carteri f. nagariensis]EFJ50175.1 hypothetical protein VOLCADRAFT_89034 [Volvox carteri f. nagariensis]|eukprot:XP_002948795.1 hypothetical protein VOLCADRAFT_89034 [Volvox carteri f. nagariensis]